MGCQSSKSDVVGEARFTKELVNSPIDIGAIRLPHRLAMGPMTRCRGDPKTGVPNDLMVDYYTQRAGFGLILTECAQVSPISNAFPGSGGIYSAEQTEGWKKVVDSVHAKGGKIVLQIWHCGRAVVPDFIRGETPIAPSPIAISTPHMTKQDHPVPKEMTEQDIKEVVEQFRKGAENAKKAGFDGVQLHGANGYLVDQFLRDGSNKRTDKYGGSIENRCRFMNEVLDALIEVFGSQRVSIRFSPTGRYNDMYDSNPWELMKYALQQCEKRNLAFVEIKRHGGIDMGKVEEGQTKDDQGRALPHLQIPDFFKTLRGLYNGVLMANDGFDPVSAQEIIRQNYADIVSFSSLAITNPDLPERIMNGWELETKQDYSTFFAGGVKGYSDYPNYVKSDNELLDNALSLGSLRVPHRVAMGPMTRCRGDPKTGVPNDLMSEYYTQRAGFGLILTECSQVSPLSNAFPGSGGIYNAEQTEGWKKIVDAVHAKGSKIVLQIWHCGRAVVPDFIGGNIPIAPSAIAISTPHMTKQDHPVPKEMTEQDIKEVIEQFRNGAENAKKAGFDGVQLHGANGYLVDQFLKDGTNKRTDKYGGSIENRCRFMSEVLDALIDVFGSDKVSIRFSPTGRYNDMYDSNPLELIKHALKICEQKQLGFVEIKRHGGMEMGNVKEGQTKDDQGRTLPQVQIPDFFKTLRPLYRGVLMANDGFDPQSAEQIVKDGYADIVSFSSLAIVNPDLVNRIRNKQEVVTKQDYGTYFQGGADGYTSYKNFAE